MILNSEREVANTRVKLARLETRYETLRHRTGGDEHVRDLTMQSLKRVINQFKEEIARYEAGLRGDGKNGRHRRDLQNDIELVNTQEKLRRLEDQYEKHRNDSAGDKRLREMTMISLKRLINQLKEEIAVYESHQPARR